MLGRLAILVLLAGTPAMADTVDAAADRLAHGLLAADAATRQEALRGIERRGRLDLVPPLIDILRFAGFERGDVGEVLNRLTGQRHGTDWHAWMLWQESQAELSGYLGYDGFKADLAALIDPAFRVFLARGRKHTIRLEEIAWGGVRKDGIPALTDPLLVDAAAAAYLDDEELVFGVAVGGDVRAYPLRIMDWHEMANDVVGGVPLALAYCTLCGSGILYETARPEGGRWTFGSSGFLYRSNKLMYDQETYSLWNQFTGAPAVGALVGQGLRLKTRPLVITSWAAWRAKHPGTRVLSLDTGHARDYRPGAPYGAYFASPDLMFPAMADDRRLQPKDHVYVVRAEAGTRAWPLERFAGGAVVNDRIGAAPVLLVGDAATRTVRAFARPEAELATAGTPDRLHGPGGVWTVEEERLVAPDGRSFARLPGHVAYWFAWRSFVPDGDTALPP